MKPIFSFLSRAILIGTLLTSCSRPPAYFQPAPPQSFKRVAIEPVVASEPQNAPDVAAEDSFVKAPFGALSESLPVSNDAVASRSNRLYPTQRPYRMEQRTLVSRPVAGAAPTITSRKATAVERFVVKKINKRLNRHLNPEQPQRDVKYLTAGAVLTLLGLILLLLSSSGTVATTIGIIALILGVAGLAYGLFKKS